MCKITGVRMMQYKKKKLLFIMSLARELKYVLYCVNSVATNLKIC
jgi:hypothetical protein